MCKDEQYKKMMGEFIKYGIIVIFIMSGVFFGLKYSSLNFSNFQEIGNFISSTFAIAVSIAGSIVAIFLALSALKTSQETNKLTETLAGDQEIQEQKQLILAKVQNSRDITINIVKNYYEIAFNIYEFVCKIKEPLIVNKINFLIGKINSLDEKIKNERDRQNINFKDSKAYIEEHQRWMDELNFIIPEFEKVRLSINEFSNALIELNKDLFSHQVYTYQFNSDLEKISINVQHKDNFYTDAKYDLINLTFQMKKYSNDFMGSYLLNLIKHIGSKVNELNKVPEIQRDLLVAIVLGYFTAPYQANNKIQLIGSVIFYDILANLPMADKIKDVLEGCESQQENTVDIKKIVNQIFCSANDIEKFIEEMRTMRSQIVDKFNVIFEFELLTDEEKKKLNFFIEKYKNLKEVDDAKNLLVEIQEDIKNYDLNSMTPYLSKINEIVGALLEAINDEN